MRARESRCGLDHEHVLLHGRNAFIDQPRPRLPERLNDLRLRHVIQIALGRGLPPVGTWTPLCQAINSIQLEGKDCCCTSGL